MVGEVGVARRAAMRGEPARMHVRQGALESSGPTPGSMTTLQRGDCHVVTRTAHAEAVLRPMEGTRSAACAREP